VVWFRWVAKAPRGLVFGDVSEVMRAWYCALRRRSRNQAMPKPAQLSILYAEDDLELLASQSAHIQKAGHAVDQVTGRKAVEESVRRKSYDLVILGDTLGKNDRHHLPYMVKKANQAIKVLVLHSTHGHPSVDKEIDSPYTPEKLMEAIASLAPQKAAAAAAGAGR